MTLCAGICQYERGGGCRIKLSEPLLKFRPSLELKETLLHEMIHAWMFLEKIRDQGDHGPCFQEKMHFINRAAFTDHQRPPQGYNITVYHSMHAEVNQYRTHHWQCPKCGNIVKRAMNRKPQEADCRGRQGKGPDCKDTKCAYHMHQRFCGGDYTKVAEPEGFGKKRSSKQGKATFADGTALPVKRARSSNTADPDASRSNKHVPAITDFFTSISREPGDGHEAEQPHCVPANEATAGSGLADLDRHGSTVEPSSVEAQGPIASLRSTAATDLSRPVLSDTTDSLQGQHCIQDSGNAVASVSGQPPLPSLRRIMADAAMRRQTVQAEGAQLAGLRLEAEKAQYEAETCTAVDARSGARAGPSTNKHATACASNDDNIASVSAVIDLVEDDREGCQELVPIGLKQHSLGQETKPPCCPVCGLTWSQQTTNREMNEHIDTCLLTQLL